MKFKIGDKVYVRGDLKVGQIYYNEGYHNGDKLSAGMRKNLGKQAEIIDIINNGYILDIDPIHKYYDGMLEPVLYNMKFNVLVDELASQPYTFNDEVEKVLEKSLKEHYERLINKALEERMFETNPEEFQKLVDIYKVYI